MGQQPKDINKWAKAKAEGQNLTNNDLGTTDKGNSQGASFKRQYASGKG